MKLCLAGSHASRNDSHKKHMTSEPAGSHQIEMDSTRSAAGASSPLFAQAHQTALGPVKRFPCPTLSPVTCRGPSIVAYCWQHVILAWPLSTGQTLPRNLTTTMK
jgi:hypothetical protein